MVSAAAGNQRILQITRQCSITAQEEKFSVQEELFYIVCLVRLLVCSAQVLHFMVVICSLEKKLLWRNILSSLYHISLDVLFTLHKVHFVWQSQNTMSYGLWVKNVFLYLEFLYTMWQMCQKINVFLFFYLVVQCWIII